MICVARSSSQLNSGLIPTSRRRVWLRTEPRKSSSALSADCHGHTESLNHGWLSDQMISSSMRSQIRSTTIDADSPGIRAPENRSTQYKTCLLECDMYAAQVALQTRPWRNNTS